MFRKSNLKNLLMLLILACITFSCTKEKGMETESFQMSPITQCTSSDENDQSICGLVRGANPGTPSIHAWPRVLDSLSQLSKFKDYDFHNFTINVTEGNEIVYIIPNNTYFIGYDYLYVITDPDGGVTVWSLYLPEGDKGFDYFYQNGLNCEFSFSDFDTGEGLLTGYGNFRDNSMSITSFNYSYFFYGKEQQPGGEQPGNPQKPWLCGMSMGVVTGVWSTAVGAASLGVGFVVGMGFTTLSIWVCNH